MPCSIHGTFNRVHSQCVTQSEINASPWLQLYLKDKCYAGTRCNQAHIAREWMQRVGDSLTAIKDAGCCHRHGDPAGNPHRTEISDVGELYIVFGDELVKVDVDQIAYTRYCQGQRETLERGPFFGRPPPSSLLPPCLSPPPVCAPCTSRISAVGVSSAATFTSAGGFLTRRRTHPGATRVALPKKNQRQLSTQSYLTSCLTCLTLPVDCICTGTVAVGVVGDLHPSAHKPYPRNKRQNTWWL